MEQKNRGVTGECGGNGEAAFLTAGQGKRFRLGGVARVQAFGKRTDRAIDYARRCTPL